MIEEIRDTSKWKHTDIEPREIERKKRKRDKHGTGGEFADAPCVCSGLQGKKGQWCTRTDMSGRRLLGIGTLLPF